MNELTINYKVKEDLSLLLEDDFTISTLSLKTGVSERTIKSTLSSYENLTNKTLEKLYSFIYRQGYRLNIIKEELYKESYKNLILFHGSKHGINSILPNGSRDNCDFGEGLYLGETFNQAISFVSDFDSSCVYSFNIDINNLKVVKFDCSFDWLIAVCYYRGYIEQYKSNKTIAKLIKSIDDCDLIIAPIADNKMFYIMQQFAEGEITSEVAMHSLSASNLGNQYVLKSEKAINQLIPLEKHYICNEEKEDSLKEILERGKLIETKLKVSKRDYRNKGKFIDELFE